MTWEQFAADYTPGEYGRDVTPQALQRDCDTLQRLLAVALHRYERKAA